MKKVIFAMATVIFGGLAHAQEVYKDSNWTTVKSVNSMTDAVSCAVSYNKDERVQATPDKLYIVRKGLGGVSGYRYRIDDEPASELSLASEIEKNLSVIIIPMSTHIEKATRIRVEGLSVLSTLISLDIDVTGLDTALAACQI
jgi:hypothetical protein